MQHWAEPARVLPGRLTRTAGTGEANAVAAIRADSTLDALSKNGSPERRLASAADATSGATRSV